MFHCTCRQYLDFVADPTLCTGGGRQISFSAVSVCATEASLGVERRLKTIKTRNIS